MANERYLLAYTQTLERAPYVSHPGGEPPYTLAEQRKRQEPQLRALAADIAHVPAAAMASSQVVAVLRLNPQALSRSAFPQALFKHADLRLLGSRSAQVKPQGGRAATKNKPTLTTDLFVAASAEKLNRMLPLLMASERLAPKDPIASDFRGLEEIHLMSVADRVKPGIREKPDDVELVLHYDAQLDVDWYGPFTKFAKHVGVELDPGLEFASGGLLFMAATATRAAARELAQYTFVRAIRPLPEPRPLEQPKVLRSAKSKAVLPSEPPVDPGVSIAVFDGGLPANHPFGQWATAYEPFAPHDIGAPVSILTDHGLSVTSAALFGSIEPGVVAPRPYAKVDHYRVLGTNTQDKKGLYRSLALIDDILAQRSYQFISLSLGPPDPMDDDNVSPWTTLLDDHLGDGNALACVAVGNNGAGAHPKCRVLAPADSVNALGVGACNASEGVWSRAAYSAVGPGRSPGLVKPDVLHFGGVDNDPYLFAGLSGQVLQTTGTSFAAPGLTRMAAGMRSHFGSKLSPMALKALLVHCSERDSDVHSMLEVGWGRACHSLHALTVCPPGYARVIYSGKMQPGGVLRAPVLVPSGLSGKVTIRATLCYSCRTDPNTPGDYTRAGLDITFRPDATSFKIDKATGKTAKNPASNSFFKQHDHLTEDERRLLAQKWNTVMHAEHNKYVTSLNAPCFDLHYIAREPGRSATPSGAPEIHFALVISLIQGKTPDIYERVQAEFPTLVSQIGPVIAIESTVTT